MKASRLTPPCEERVLFSHDKLWGVPEVSGCYVLSNCQGEILYVGQAISLRNRMDCHLNSRKKTAVTELGATFWFHYRVAETHQLNRIELGWWNQHRDIEGKPPILNKQRPPTP